MFCSLFGWAQPQRDMRWLHGLLNVVEQVLTQLAQVYFTAKCCAESLQCPGCIILATVEATIDKRLQTMAQGLEESRDGERRGNNDDWRLRGLSSEQAHQRLQTDHEANVDQCQDSRQRAIDQGAIDQHIDIVQTMAQDCHTNRNRKRE